MQEQILTFIKHFAKNDSIIDLFLNGCCYWFSAILMQRFQTLNPILMYDEVINHFGVLIDGFVYDITGNVTNQYNWQEWSKITDELHRERIIRDCINFEERRE